MRKKTHHNKNGFTLLELLVVIAIVAILAAVAIISYTAARRKSRDSRRQNDIKVIQQAFEQYFLDENGYDTATDCDAMKDEKYFPGGFPKDPRPDVYQYTCGPDPFGGTGYCICAQLEDGNGNAHNGTCADYGETADDRWFFCQVSLYY